MPTCVLPIEKEVEKHRSTPALGTQYVWSGTVDCRQDYICFVLQLSASRSTQRKSCRHFSRATCHSPYACITFLPSKRGVGLARASDDDGRGGRETVVGQIEGLLASDAQHSERRKVEEDTNRQTGIAKIRKAHCLRVMTSTRS